MITTELKTKSPNLQSQQWREFCAMDPLNYQQGEDYLNLFRKFAAEYQEILNQRLERATANKDAWSSTYRDSFPRIFTALNEGEFDKIERPVPPDDLILSLEQFEKFRTVKYSIYTASEKFRTNLKSLFSDFSRRLDKNDDDEYKFFHPLRDFFEQLASNDFFSSIEKNWSPIEKIQYELAQESSTTRFPDLFLGRLLERCSRLQDKSVLTTAIEYIISFPDEFPFIGPYLAPWKQLNSAKMVVPEGERSIPDRTKTLWKNSLNAAKPLGGDEFVLAVYQLFARAIKSETFPSSQEINEIHRKSYSVTLTTKNSSEIAELLSSLNSDSKDPRLIRLLDALRNTLKRSDAALKESTSVAMQDLNVQIRHKFEAESPNSQGVYSREQTSRILAGRIDAPCSLEIRYIAHEPKNKTSGFEQQMHMHNPYLILTPFQWYKEDYLELTQFQWYPEHYYPSDLGTAVKRSLEYTDPEYVIRNLEVAKWILGAFTLEITTAKNPFIIDLPGTELLSKQLNDSFEQIRTCNDPTQRAHKYTTLFNEVLNTIDELEKSAIISSELFHYSLPNAR